MSYSNRVFNVNGIGEDILLDTLRLAFKLQSGWDSGHCEGWRVCDKGLILYKYVPSNVTTATKFPVNMSADQVAPIVDSWLRTEAAMSLDLTGWDADADHDGTNDIGWRVFCEDWGHVDGDWGVICCVTPAYIWYGK